MSNIKQKINKLEKLIKGLSSVIVAFSGGVDSSFLLAVCCRVLKDRVLAVTALSETYTEEEAVSAKKMALSLGCRHIFVRTREFEDRTFRSNPENRCYYCKKELFRRLKNMAMRKGFSFVLDGSNADDQFDYRPGAKAKAEADIISPLLEAGMTKKDVRTASRSLGLETWNKPAMPCLASRVPYGSRITKKRLLRIGKAESRLKAFCGIRGNLRVRDFWPEALIESDRYELPLLKRSKEQIGRILGELGYSSIKFRDYRMGSLNKVKSL